MVATLIGLQVKSGPFSLNNTVARCAGRLNAALEAESGGSLLKNAASAPNVLL